ncbi:LysR family transcriptional regulator [Comamonas sp. JC664]|uniref:helix-turn-helix domain-containing protein n=1 Tax=Comamonas sp. JC664 TaxID=2801917 RepID=UPI00360F8291
MDRLHAIDVFLAIAEQGSLTRAAEALELSLPSVVRTLAALEKHLGVRLFNRNTRRLPSPTKAAPTGCMRWPSARSRRVGAGHEPGAGRAPRAASA